MFESGTWVLEIQAADMIQEPHEYLSLDNICHIVKQLKEGHPDCDVVVAFDREDT